MIQKLPDDTKVLTTDGFKLVRELNIEDFVLDKYERPFKILHLKDYNNTALKLKLQGDNEVMVFSDTTFFTSKAGDGMTRGRAKITDAELICNYFDLQLDKTRPRWPLIDLKPVPEYEDVSKIKDIIDPYTLGFLLGDGCFRGGASATFCCGDKFIVDKIKSIHGDAVSDWKDGKGGITHNIKGLYRTINALGLQNTCSETKFIPELDYSLQDLVNLIQGMMDADGCVNKDTSIELTLKSEPMIDTIKSIIERLGGTATKKVKIGTCKEYDYEGLYLRLYIRHPDASILFSLPRKIERTKLKPLRNRVLDYSKHGTNVSGKVINTNACSLILDNYIICNNT